MSQSEIKGEGDVREGCPEGVYIETAGEWIEVMGTFLASFKCMLLFILTVMKIPLYDSDN